MAKTTAGDSFSMVAAVAALDDAGLVALLQARPDLAHPPPADLTALAQRGASAPSARAAYDTLDRGAQGVVEALCHLPRPATLSALAAALGPGVEVDDLEGPLERLRALALAFRRGDRVDLNPGLTALRHAAGLGPALSAALGRRTHRELADVAKRLRVKSPGTKAGMIGVLAAVLADPDRLRSFLASAPDGTAELAEEIARHGPELILLGGAFGLDDHIPPGWLFRRGLLAPVAWDRLVMPAEVALALRGGRLVADFSPGPPPIPAVPADQAKADAMGAERAVALLAAVVAVLESWSSQPPKLLKDGGVGARDVKRVAKLLERDARETARIVELAAVAGLVAADRDAGVVLPTAAFDAWLAGDVPARWRALLSAWITSPVHVSVAGVIEESGKAFPPLLPRLPEPHAAERRTDVLAAMAAVPEGAAATPGAVATRARWAAPSRWMRVPGGSDLYVEWAIEECELLGLWALGSLTALGRAAAAGDVDGATAALARHCPAPMTEIVIQADLTAVAPGPLVHEVAAEMELLADVESRGAATVYRFSEASVRRAFDAGRSADGIAAFLERHSTRGVPQPLAYLVADVARRHARARVGTARAYVRSDDAALVGELARSRALSRLRPRLLAPTVLAADAEPGAVLAALRDAGYLPAEEDAAGALVVTRPAARRASHPLPPPGSPAPHAPPGGHAPSTDLAALVEILRKRVRPSPPNPKPKSKAAPRFVPPPLPALFDDDRPTGIVRSPGDVFDLLEQAWVDGWAVRVSYLNGKARSTQLNIIPLEFDDDYLLAECLPQGDLRRLNLARAEWARVLTEAEEDQVL